MEEKPLINETEIYLATMDVVRRMQTIAEVLRLRIPGLGDQADPVFSEVREAMEAFFVRVTPPLKKYSKPRLKTLRMPQQPYADYC